MKVLQNVIEVQEEGFLALIGKNVEIYCGVYIYAGKLVGVNTTCIKLENPHIVYETGTHTDKKYKDAQPLNKDAQYIMVHAVESFGLSTKLG